MTTPTPDAPEIERLAAVALQIYEDAAAYDTFDDLPKIASALRTIPTLIADADNDRSRYKAQIEGLREALIELGSAACELFGWHRTDRYVSHPEEAQADFEKALAMRDHALSQSRADLLARREAERKVIEAAGRLKFTGYPAHGSGFVIMVSEGSVDDLTVALAALAEQEAAG